MGDKPIVSNEAWVDDEDNKIFGYCAQCDRNMPYAIKDIDGNLYCPWHFTKLEDERENSTQEDVKEELSD